MRWILLGVGVAFVAGAIWFLRSLSVAMRFFRESDTPDPHAKRPLDNRRHVRTPKRPR
jgi:hypothetical protein